MGCSDRWNIFAQTGKIDDYLCYRHGSGEWGAQQENAARQNTQNKWTDGGDGTGDCNGHGDFGDAYK